MRRTAPFASSVALVLALVLAGCFGQDAEEGPRTEVSTPESAPAPSASANDVAALSRVELSGDPGTLPGFEFSPPLVVTGEVARVAREGVGDVVELGAAVLLDVASVKGADGTAIGDSYSGVPEMMIVGESTLPTALLRVLVGERVGARLLYAFRGEDGAAILSQFEVISTQGVLKHAEGRVVTLAADLPTVTRAEDGHPVIERVGGAPPTDLTSEPLIVGEGETVESDAWIAFHYSCWLWNGTEVDTSWDEGPVVQLLSDDIVGLRERMVGRTVGSQMIMIVPPGVIDFQQLEGVPGDAALVFVIDILAVVNPTGGGMNGA